MAAERQRSKTARTDSSAAAKPRVVQGGNSLDLDKLIHERTRLAIVSTLAANKHMSFNDLKSELKISDGNLSTHARKLETAGYVSCKKDFQGRMPRTRYTLTAKGRKALNHYISHMESLIHSMKSS